jgi:hypothetical protein
VCVSDRNCFFEQVTVVPPEYLVKLCDFLCQTEKSGKDKTFPNKS